MANKNYRGIFLDPISEGVKNELNRRENVQKNRNSLEESSDNTFIEESKKLSWCKLLSNAVSDEITDKIRYENQLYMGHLSVKSTTSQVFLGDFSEGFGKSNQFDYDLGKNSQNRPRPGIDKVSIINKGSLGSIRVATIDYFVHTEADLKLMEQLYMVPGITCLLEWGWSNFTGNSIQDKDLSTMGEVQLKILEKSLDMNNLGDQDISGNAGRYDGMLGVITKFNWDVQADGSYSCQTTIMSPNGLIGELPTKTSNYFMQGKEILWSSAKNTISEQKDLDRTVHMYTDIEGILQYFKQLGQLPADLNSGDKSDTFNNIFQLFLGYDEFFKNSPIQNIPWVYAEGKYNGPIFSNLFTVKPEFYSLEESPSKILAKSSEEDIDKAIKKLKSDSLGNEVGWEGRTYGFNTYFPGTDGSEISPVSFVSWRFIEDVLLDGLKVTKKYNGKKLLKLKSVHDYTKTGLVESNKIRNHKYIRSLDHNICFLPGQCGLEGITLWNDNKKIFDIDEKNSRLVPPIPYPSKGNIFGAGRVISNKRATVNFYSNIGKFVHEIINEKGYMIRNSTNDLETDLSENAIIDDLKLEIAPNKSTKQILTWVKGGVFSEGVKLDATEPDKPETLTRKREQVFLDSFSTGLQQEKSNDEGIYLQKGEHEWENKYSAGHIRNIMLNVDFVLETYHSTSHIKDFIKSLLDGINEACGSPWDFQIQANENTPDTLSIVDSNWSRKLNFVDKKLDPNEVYIFKPNTHSSIIKNIKLTSKLPSKIQAAAFIGASRNSQQGQKDGTGAWTAFSQGITDRYNGVSELLEYPIPKEKAFTQKVLSPGEVFLAKNYEYNLSIYSDKTAGLEAKDHLNQYINNYPNVNIGPDKPTRPLIPLDLSLNLDGISGIYMGNAITVSPVKEGGILPDRYQDKTVFQVTSVTHTLGGFDWETTIEGMMRVVNFVGKHSVSTENSEQAEGSETTEESEEREVSEEDIIAATLVHEAAGHGTLGMAAVMLVINNRKRSNFGEFKRQGTYTEVILRRNAFEPWNGVTGGKGSGRGSTKFEVVEVAKKQRGAFKNAQEIYNKLDSGKLPQGIVGQALNFVNPDIVSSRGYDELNPPWAINLMDAKNAENRRIIYTHVFTKMISKTEFKLTGTLPGQTKGGEELGFLLPAYNNFGPRPAWDGNNKPHRSIVYWEDKLKELFGNSYKKGPEELTLNQGNWYGENSGEAPGSM